MNYNRRSTRPDAGFYRESRKLRKSRAQQIMKPTLLIVLIVVLAMILFFIFRRP